MALEVKIMVNPRWGNRLWGKGSRRGPYWWYSVLDLRAGLWDRFSCETSARCPFMVSVLICMYNKLFIKNLYRVQIFRPLWWKVCSLDGARDFACLRSTLSVWEAGDLKVHSEKHWWRGLEQGCPRCATLTYRLFWAKGNPHPADFIFYLPLHCLKEIR